MKFKKIILFLAVLMTMKNQTSYCLETSNIQDNKNQSLILFKNNYNLTKLWDHQIGMLGILSLQESEYLHNIWSNIIDEYQKYMLIFKSLKKNYNSCFDFFKEILSRALALSMRSNHDCLNVHRTNYTNIIALKIRSAELETIFPQCYPHYSSKEILNCLDESSKNDSTIGIYNSTVNFITNYNDDLFEPMHKCIERINININESIIYTKNEFEYCTKHQNKLDKKNDTLDISVDDSLKSIDNSYKKKIDDIKIKFSNFIEINMRISFNYFDNLTNVSCCGNIPKKFLTRKINKMTNDTGKCFSKQLFVLKYFNDSISKANELELFTKSCTQDDILPCNQTDILQSDAFIKIYKSIKINMIKESKASILNIYKCLGKIEQRFKSFINYANFQFNLCAAKQEKGTKCQIGIANDNWLFGFIWKSGKIPNLG